MLSDNLESEISAEADEAPENNGVLTTEDPVKSKAVAKPKVRKIPVCWFYSKYKSCKYKENCRYRHSEPNKNTNRLPKPNKGNTTESIETLQLQPTQEPELINPKSQHELPNEVSQNEGDVAQKLDEDNLKLNTNAHGKTPSEKSNNVKERRKKIRCYFFKRFKTCKFGEKCDFSHENPRKNKTTEDKTQLQNSVTAETAQEEPTCNSTVTNENQQKSQNLNTKNIPLSTLNHELLEEFRKIEITQLKKRFRGKNIDEIDGQLFVLVKATDPDWPFEVSSVWIEVVIPENYPKEMLKITVPDEQNDVMPDLLVKYLSNSILSWLSERHKKNQENEMTELVFRPFLRWFDRQMESLFVEGLKSVKRNLAAKSAGLEFVSPVDLQMSLSKNDESVSADVSIETEPENKPNEILVKKELNESYLSLDSDVKSACLNLVNLSVSAKSNRETSIPVDDSKAPKGTAIKAIDYSLSENIATLICSKISVVVQCTRCRTKCDFNGSPKKTQKLSCQKCNHIMNVTFRSTILHQYSAVIGYLDVEGCKAFDVILLKCEFNITCLNCNKSFSVMGLSNGHSNTSFCLKCHTRSDIMLGTFKFQVYDPPSVSNKVDSKLIKMKKDLKDSAIQDGKPLPDNETDHEMKYAARMLCGHCAKEQTFSHDKPCIRCNSDLTKKSAGHWDNGKGCRNKVKMSKDDRQKYAGLNKTTARKVEDKKAEKKSSL
ncbi:hypothetical protein GQR58_017650 [Nymphon striatum]|nr:hypothetical protein GQR58_017650 [Nymphon striatum]